jgi:hypothetical protein
VWQFDGHWNVEHGLYLVYSPGRLLPLYYLHVHILAVVGQVPLNLSVKNWLGYLMAAGQAWRHDLAILYHCPNREG